jgi:hypothetical protein
MHPAICGQVIKKKICTVSQGYRSARQDPVQNMYAVYKMRVISQNSRRKASAEDERSNVLYCMHNTLEWRLKDTLTAVIFLLQKYRSARQSPVQNGVSSIYLQLLIFCCVRTNMAALFLTYIEKMTACNFLSAMKILIYYGTAEIYVSLFGTAQMIGIFQG